MRSPSPSPSRRPHTEPHLARWRAPEDSADIRLRRVRPATVRFTDPSVTDYQTHLVSEVVVRLSVRAAPTAAQAADGPLAAERTFSQPSTAVTEGAAGASNGFDSVSASVSASASASTSVTGVRARDSRSSPPGSASVAGQGYAHGTSERAPEVEVNVSVLSRSESSVGTLVSSVRSDALPLSLKNRRLRLLHSGRLLADRGVLLVDWLDTLDARRAAALSGTPIAAEDGGLEARHLPAWERTVTLAAAPPPSATLSSTFPDEGDDSTLIPRPPGEGSYVAVAGLRIPLPPLLHAVRPSVLAQHSLPLGAPGIGRRNHGTENAIFCLPLELPPDPAALADLDSARTALARLVPQSMRAAWTTASAPHLLPLHATPGNVLFDQDGATSAPNPLTGLPPTSSSPPDREESRLPLQVSSRDKGKGRATDIESGAIVPPSDHGTTSPITTEETFAHIISSHDVVSIASERVYLQCAVGSEDEESQKGGGAEGTPSALHTLPGSFFTEEDETEVESAQETSGAQSARGLDQLVASGALSSEEVDRIRRVFLYSRPELLRGRTGDALQARDEEAHIRALEDQWLSSAGPMGGAAGPGAGGTGGGTAPQGQEWGAADMQGGGTASQAWIGMMVGFFFPFTALFFIADRPHPSFFPTLSAHSRVVESDSESDLDETDDHELDGEDEDRHEENDNDPIDLEAELPAGAQQARPPARFPHTLRTPRPRLSSPADPQRSMAPPASAQEAVGDPPAHMAGALSPPQPARINREEEDEPLADLASRVAQRRPSSPPHQVRRYEARSARSSPHTRRAAPVRPLVSLEWGDALRDALAQGLRARRRAARWEARVSHERSRRMAIEVRRRARGGALVSPSVRSGIFVGLATNIFIAIFRWFFTPP